MDRFDLRVAFAAAIALVLCYFGYTTYTDRAYDAPEHLQYIEWVAMHRSLPPADACGVCQHPPLYYLAGAGIWTAARDLGVDPPRCLQVLSVVAWFAFVGIALRWIGRLLGPERTLAAALVVTWPAGILASVRLHNDGMTYAFVLAAVVTLHRQDTAPRRGGWWAPAILTGAALLTKSSAMVVLAAVVIVAIAAVRGGRATWRDLLGPGLILAGAVLLRQALQPLDGACSRLVGVGCTSAWPMPNTWRAWFGVAWEDLVSGPWAVTKVDGYGRQFVWLHFWKTSLFGAAGERPDAETTYRLNRWIAWGMYGIAAAFLPLLAAAVVTTIGTEWRERTGRWRVPLLFTLLSIASLASFRLLAPRVNHQDFRHVLPVIVPLSAMYARFATEAPRPIAVVARVLGWSFVALSALWVIPKQGVLARWAPHEVLLATDRPLLEDGIRWGDPRLLELEAADVAVARFAARSVESVAYSLDADDEYKIALRCGDGEHVRAIATSRRVRRGIANEVWTLTTPASGCTELRIRPIEGDDRYTLGSVRVSP